VPHLGKVRADHEYPMQSFFREGVLVASSSDYPVTLPPNPLAGIETGVLRWYQGASRDSEILRPSEHCTIRQMIDSFTINGSKSMLLEKTSGTIEVGRSADLLVLSRNILKISPKLIGDSKHTRVPSTCFQGKRCSTPAVLKQKCGNHRAFGAARLSRRAASVDSRQQ
jgi:predicted amidohydrolase YtcJ